MTREEELFSLFDKCGDDVKALFHPMIKLAVKIEEELFYYYSLPQLRIHPTDPAKQKPTEAAKQIQKRLPTYTAVIRTLAAELHKTEPDAAEELMKRLEQFK